MRNARGTDSALPYHRAMPEHLIHKHFVEAADLLYPASEQLPKGVAAAAEALVAALTSGGKVLIAGVGSTALLARHLAGLLVGGFERERPELAAVALSEDPSFTVAATTANAAGTERLARQVRALGLAPDVLVILAMSGNEPALLRALEVAHERELSVVAITGQGGGALARGLRETDVWLGVPHERSARVFEAQTLLLHALCDELDLQLLGEPETP